MADANNPQGGSPSSPGSKSESSVPEVSGPGIFRPAPVLQKDSDFDVYGRLTTQNKSLLRQNQVDGIRKKGEPKPLSKEEEIRLTTRIDFLVKKAEELHALRSDLDNDDGKEQLEGSFGEIIGELKEMRVALTSPALDKETLDQVKEALEERERDIDAHQEAHRQTIQSLVQEKSSNADIANREKEELEKELRLKLEENEKSVALSKIGAADAVATAKAELEKASYVTELRVRYEKLAKDVERIKATSLPIFGKDKLIGEYESFSYLVTEKSPSVDDIQIANSRIPELEDLVTKATDELHALETEGVREKRQLERMAGVSIANFENKKLEAISLLQNKATSAEKDSVELLITELDTLRVALDSDDVTEGKVQELSQKTSLLATKIEELKALIVGGTNEKITELRNLEKIIADFDNKRVLVTSLLTNPAADGERVATNRLLADIDALRTSLKNSNDVDEVEVVMLRDKVSNLDTKIDEIQALIDTENRRQESMMSWHAEWPKEIKYAEAKKPSRPGATGERGGWKKDGQLLKDQAMWGKLNTQAKRVFERYNTLIDKALSFGKDGDVKDLIVIKETVISALYSERTGDAGIELTRLEKELEARRGEVENEVELKELTVKFEGITKTLERLTSIAPLEKDLLDAKKKEIENLLAELGSDNIRKDDIKTKELLRLLKAILGELASAVEEKDKDGKREAAERLSEFKQLSRRLEQTRTEILHKLPKETSDEDKQSLLKKLDDIETKAKDFSANEIAKEYSKARETLFLFKSSLDSLTTSIQEKVAATKALVSKSGETKTFGQAVSLFEQLKAEIADLEPANEEEAFFRRSISEREKASFEKLVAELEEIKTSRASTTDKKALDEKDLLFRSLLIDLTSFVTQKMGDEDKLKTEIAALKQKLASTTSEKEKDRLLLKIARLERTFNGILSLKEARRSTAPRKTVLRPVKDGATILLREKDPLTGEAVEMKVSEWRELQKNTGEVSSMEKAKKKQQAEEELRAIHKAMWQRDPEGYKSLYAGRVWTASGSNELIQKIVKEILDEKIALVDERLEFHQTELDERNDLIRRLKTGALSQSEQARLTTLETQLAPWINERESLTERPYEEQLRMMREQAAEKSELRNQQQMYSPSNDRKMDRFPVKGVAGEEFRKKGLFNTLFGKTTPEQKRYQDALKAQAEEVTRAARDKIPGFTKVAPNTSPLMGKLVDPIVRGDFDMIDPSKGDLGGDMRKLAETVYEEKVKLGSKEAGANNAGMTRSMMREDRMKNDGSVEARQGAYENAPKIKAPLTQEQQERKVARVNGLIGTLTKVVKSWRAWALVAALGTGMGGASVAFAQADPTRPVTTIEQNLSWKDFLGDLGDGERASLESIIRDLLSK